MKQRIILNGCQRHFDDLADEIRHDRAATTTLWFKMRDIGDRHVERDIQLFEPFLLAQHGAGTKTLGLQPAQVPVDLCCALGKLLSVVEKITVVVQVVEIGLESSTT